MKQVWWSWGCRFYIQDRLYMLEGDGMGWFYIRFFRRVMGDCSRAGDGG
jgi:hypothetical protein